MRLFKIAKAVLEKADADQDEVDQAALALNTAIQNLKPVDGGSGDGNGEGNGNGSTGGNGKRQWKHRRKRKR